MSATPAEPAPSGNAQASQFARIVLPALVLFAGLVLWELVVRINDIQPYVLPAPWLVFKTMVADWEILFQSLLVTLLTTLEGFVCAAVGAFVPFLFLACVGELADLIHASQHLFLHGRLELLEAMVDPLLELVEVVP